MISAKKTLTQIAFATLFGVGALAATAGSASAYVVCNHDGDCWHTDSRGPYAPSLGIQVHPDDWYFHHDWTGDRDHHWRAYHDGRGYYRGGLWITL